MSDEEKEQQKLTATWLNTLAGSSITAGVFGPLVAYQTGLATAANLGDFVGGSALWFSVGIALHIVAQVSLWGYGEQ